MPRTGLLRSGQSLTPFVLGALLRVPDATAPAPAGAVDRAIAFIRRHTSPDGAVGVTGGDADYPNYATALAVDALVAAQRVRFVEGRYRTDGRATASAAVQRG